MNDPILVAEEVEFKKILLKEWQDLKPEHADALVFFRNLILKENTQQNLTRLLNPKDFYYGHLQDIQELLKLSSFDYSTLDIGSGAGIPGLPLALITGNSFFLCDSEKKKADFILRATEEMGLSNIKVYSDRAEKIVLSTHPKRIISRAVGKMEHVLKLVYKSSTWNEIIFLKGPNWEQEWEDARPYRKDLTLKIKKTHEYVTRVKDEERQRVIIQIERVPRGT